MSQAFPPEGISLGTDSGAGNAEIQVARIVDVSVQTRAGFLDALDVDRIGSESLPDAITDEGCVDNQDAEE